MNRFTSRSNMPELIDQPGIPFADWRVCLKELDVVNTWLGGHAITVDAIVRLSKGRNQPLRIAEIGCGGGDNLMAIYRKFASAGNTYIGIDINEACTTYARENCSSISSVQFICSDYRKVDFGSSRPDIIFNSLFCHHFSNEQLLEMIEWMRKNSRIGFFINDLHRHPAAYYSIALLTRFFSRSYLVKNDAPISVLRGFKKKEWNELMKESGVTDFELQWRWAFRYLIYYKHAQF